MSLMNLGMKLISEFSEGPQSMLALVVRGSEKEREKSIGRMMAKTQMRYCGFWIGKCIGFKWMFSALFLLQN